MKRIIYSVGFFLVLLFLSTGFLLSYQMSDLRERMGHLEEMQTKEQQVSAFADAKKLDFVFERYEKNAVKQEAYRIVSYNTNQVVLRQKKEEKTSAADGFLLKVHNGYVAVYKNGENQIFEETGIPLEILPKALQSEILLGKTIKNQDDLYDFLENYSS